MPYQLPDSETSGRPVTVIGAEQYYRLPNLTDFKNSTHRPSFHIEERLLTPHVSIEGHMVNNIHPDIITPLTNMIRAMVEEGNRLNDESLKSAFVTSAYRPGDAHEGQLFLGSLRTTIAGGQEPPRGVSNPFASFHPAFPAGLENAAQQEFTSNAQVQQFVRQIADYSSSDAWTPELAAQLVRITRIYKAPRGLSTHQSGYAVDINFKVVGNSGTSQFHNVNRGRNLAAKQTAAGHWLYRFVREFGFNFYDTAAEIWHLEYMNWHR